MKKIRLLATVLFAAVLMTAFASISFAAEEKGTGLYKDDGKWKYYENGKFTKATGLVKCAEPGSSKGKWYYVEKGVKKNVTGLVKCVQPGASKGEWYYVVKGKRNQGTGLVQCVQPGSSKGKWFYVKKGKRNKFTGYTKSIQPGKTKGKQYYVVKGKLAIDPKFTKSGNTVKTAYYTLKPKSSSCSIYEAKWIKGCKGLYIEEGNKNSTAGYQTVGNGYIAVTIKSDPIYYGYGGSNEFRKIDKPYDYTFNAETSDGMFVVYEIVTAGRGLQLNITVK